MKITFSLSTKLILSMTGMVFLTALACTVVFIIVINNQTHDFEVRLESIRGQLQTAPSAQQGIAQIKAIVDNPATSPETQVSQILQLVHLAPINIEQVRQIAIASGWPVSDTPITPNGDFPLTNIESGFLNLNLANPIYRSILIASLISVIFAVGLGFILSRTVIRPLRSLEQASERIADGNYSLILKPEGKDDLGRLATSFNKMSAALRQIEQKRKELLADISHELRTPLSTIQGYTEALRYGLVKDAHQSDETYGLILNEVSYLSKMLASLRDWVNNERALEQLDLGDFAVEPLLQATLRKFEAAATTKGVALKLGASPFLWVHTDAESLNHILNNLIDNALRYTAAGGTIEISATALSKQKQVKFEVRDTGEGIPASDLPFVFERFYRVDKSRNRNTGGSGLGLAIVRETIHAQGGDIKIESEKGVGTCLTFYLKLSEPKELPKLEKAAL